MRYMIIVLMVLVTLAIGSYQPEIHQVSRGYVHVRPGGVSAADNALTSSTAAWYNVQGWRRIPQEWGTISVSFYGYGDGVGEGGDPEGGTFAADVYVVHEFGSAIPACSITGTIGALEMSHDPASGPGSQYRTSQVADPNHKWAEGPILVTSKQWRRPVFGSGTTGGIGEINFDHGGATHIYVRFSNITDVTTMYAVMTGRK